MLIENVKTKKVLLEATTRLFTFMIKINTSMIVIHAEEIYKKIVFSFLLLSVF